MTTRTDWTEELFREKVEEVQASSVWQEPQAWAFGLLHCFGPTALVARFVPSAVNYGDNLNMGMLAHVLDVAQFKWGEKGSARLYDEGVMLSEYDLAELANRTAWVDDGPHRNVEMVQSLRSAETSTNRYGCKVVPYVVAIPDLTAPLASLGDSYLRDYLFSLGVVDPEVIDTGWTSRFPMRPTFVATSAGYMTPEGAQAALWDAALSNTHLEVFSIDKVVFMVDHVIPKGVRVPASYTVRLGGHLEDGATVMPSAGYVNIEAVAGGMIEGRHSGRVRQRGTHNDVGGGASILGSMSGGNDIVVSIGSGNLLEANCGLGIVLGDRNRIEAGHYVKSTNMVRITNPDEWGDNEVVKNAIAQHAVQRDGYFWVKAVHLSMIDDAIFRRNDFDGASEVVARGDSTWGSLNELLHAHN